MSEYTNNEMEEALRAIAATISKREKVLQTFFLV